MLLYGKQRKGIVFMNTYTIDINNKTVTINDGTSTMTVPVRFIEEISNNLDKNLYYANDVKTELEKRIKNGSIPEILHDNKEFFEDILDDYAERRVDAEGDSWGDSWEVCLETAFDNAICCIEKYLDD